MAHVAEVIIKARDLMSGELEKASSKLDKIRKDLLKVGLAAGAMSAGLVYSMKKVVDAAAEQQKQEYMLAQAMKHANVFTAEAYKHALDYASALQQQTIYGDEAILGVQRLLVQFGVSGEMLDKLTAATLDLASAQRMDLKSAANLVAKSVGSTTNALDRYGIKIDNTARGTERAAQLVDAIAKKFGGTAQAEAQTFAGRMQQLKNVVGDLKESLGEALLPILTDFAQRATVLVGKLKSWADAHPGLIKVIMAVVAAIAGGAGLIAALAAITTIAPAVGAAFTLMTGPIGWVIAGITALVVVGWKFRRQIAEAFLKAADAVLGALEKIVGGVNWVLSKLGIHWLDGAIEAIEKARGKLQEMMADTQELGEVADAASNKVEESMNRTLKQTANLAAKASATIDDLNIKLREPAVRKIKTETERLEAPEPEGLEIEKWEEEYVDPLSILNERVMEIFGNTAKAVVSTADTIGSAFAQTVDMMLTEGVSFAEGLKRVFKDMARAVIAELTRIIAKMLVIKALKTVFGIPFKEGGIVPGFQAGGIVPWFARQTGTLALLHPGEMVLNRQQQARLMALLAGAEAGNRRGANVSIVVQTLDTENLSYALRYGELANVLRRTVQI